MRLLLDTNALIWLLTEPERLTSHALETIESTDHDVYVSVVSVWEIEIKVAKGKLRMPPDLEAALAKQRFESLPITLRHVLAVESLPQHHSDPFDRMIIVQAHLDGLTVVSSDGDVSRYPVSFMPAI